MELFDLRGASHQLSHRSLYYAVVQTLKGEPLPGSAKYYIHNWDGRLRDAVTRLESFTRAILNPESVAQVPLTATQGATILRRTIAKCAKDGAEGQNRTVDTSLFRAVLYQLSYLGIQAGLARRVPVYRITEKKSTFHVRRGGEGGI